MSGSEVWYRNGLHFECTRCGDCCTGAPGYVWVSEAEIESIARFIQEDRQAFERRFLRRVKTRYSLKERSNGDCVFFDNQHRTCRIHACRPRQCRSWPFWKTNLRSPDRWKEVCRTCPGSGEGRLFPLEEIVELVREGDGEA